MMTFPNVLILEADEHRRCQIVDALAGLGGSQILQASSGATALAILRNWPGVGIGICGLESGHLEALALAGHEGRLGALVLVGNSGELYRQARRLSHIGRLPILGCIDLPVNSQKLAEVIGRFSEHSRSLRELPSRGELDMALATGQFQARFQPVLKLADRRPWALGLDVVWRHPWRGELASCDFVPALVAYDLIDELFECVFEQGLRCLAALETSQRPLRLSCKLQASQLNTSSFIPRLLTRLRRYPVKPEQLVFQLGENGLLDLPRNTLEQLNNLQALGFGLSVDQFGSGFSSLQLLCQRPFQQVNLAPEAVQDLQTEPGQALIAGTLALAKSLKMEVVVGGVATVAQHETLTKIGCSLAHGSYYAEPMNALALYDWLKSC